MSTFTAVPEEETNEHQSLAAARCRCRCRNMTLQRGRREVVGWGAEMGNEKAETLLYRGVSIAPMSRFCRRTCTVVAQSNRILHRANWGQLRIQSTLRCRCRCRDVTLEQFSGARLANKENQHYSDIDTRVEEKILEAERKRLQE